MQLVSSANGGSMATFPLQPFKQRYKQKGNRWSTQKQQAGSCILNSFNEEQNYVTANFTSSTVHLGGGVWLLGSGFKPQIYQNMNRTADSYRKCMTKQGIIKVDSTL